MRLAADAGAELNVMTCSSTAPAVDAVRPLVGRPTLGIDEPVAAAALPAPVLASPPMLMRALISRCAAPAGGTA